MQMQTQVLLLCGEMYINSENFLFVFQHDLHVTFFFFYSTNPVGTSPDDF